MPKVLQILNVYRAYQQDNLLSIVRYITSLFVRFENNMQIAALF